LAILWLSFYWNSLDPDWILILNAIFGLIGITIGASLIKSKIVIKKALLIEIPKFIIGFAILF